MINPEKTEKADIERDRYGFLVKPGGPRTEEKAKKGSKKKTWAGYLNTINNDFTQIKYSKSLRNLVRREGVPTEIRGRIWIRLSKAFERNAPMPYKKILETFSGQESDHTKQIEKDLRRTFPDNAVFESEEGIAALRRVLVAYSWLNPEIGYCQSMNFICALYLLFLDEEDSFWLLKATMEDILPSDYYTQGMLGVRTDERVLKELLSQKLSKVYQHLEKYEIELSGFVTAWFMSLFVNILPLETTLRVFDSLFCEGSKVLLRVCLALFKLNEKNILKEKSFEGVYSVLKQLPHTATDPGKLIDVAFNRDWTESKKLSIQKMRVNIWSGLQRAYLTENEKNTILHFTVEGENVTTGENMSASRSVSDGIIPEAKGPQSSLYATIRKGGQYHLPGASFTPSTQQTSLQNRALLSTTSSKNLLRPRKDTTSAPPNRPPPYSPKSPTTSHKNQLREVSLLSQSDPHFLKETCNALREQAREELPSRREGPSRKNTTLAVSQKVPPPNGHALTSRKPTPPPIHVHSSTSSLAPNKPPPAIPTQAQPKPPTPTPKPSSDAAPPSQLYDPRFAERFRPLSIFFAGPSIHPTPTPSHTYTPEEDEEDSETDESHTDNVTPCTEPLENPNLPHLIRPFPDRRIDKSRRVAIIIRDKIPNIHT